MGISTAAGQMTSEEIVQLSASTRSSRGRRRVRSTRSRLTGRRVYLYTPKGGGSSTSTAS